MAITKYSMLTKGQRQRLAAFRRRQATRKTKSRVLMGIKGPQLSKTARTQLRYAAGPEVAKIFAKKPATGMPRTRKMVMNNGMGAATAATATRGTRTSTRLAGVGPQYLGLVNQTRRRATPGAGKLSENNLNSLLKKFSGLRTTNY